MNTFEKEVNSSLELLEEEDKLQYDRIKDDRFNIRTSKYDFWAVTCQGVFFGIEAKSTKLKSLPFQNIRPHQMDNLRKLEEKFKNCVGLFVVNFRHGKGKIKAFAVRASDMNDYINKAERKSFPHSFFVSKGVELPRIDKPEDSKILWDFTEILGLEHVPIRRK